MTEPRGFGRPKKRRVRGDTDPEKDARQYFRHAETGDLGYLVMRDGAQKIRYDQPGMDRVVQFKAGDWIPEKDVNPLSLQALARIAFEADKALCAAIGLYAESRREWLNLRDRERIEWTNDGPSGNEHRTGLFNDIMSGSLERLVKQ